MTDNNGEKLMKFGPEWLQNNLSRGNAFGQSASANNAPKPIRNPPKPIEVTEPQFRYKRDELLALYDGKRGPPDELKEFKLIYVNKPQLPIALQFCPKRVRAKRPLLARSDFSLNPDSRFGRQSGFKDYNRSVNNLQPNWRNQATRVVDSEDKWRNGRYDNSRTNNRWTDKNKKDYDNNFYPYDHDNRRSPDDMLPEWASNGDEVNETGTFDASGAFLPIVIDDKKIARESVIEDPKIMIEPINDELIDNARKNMTRLAKLNLCANSGVLNNIDFDMIGKSHISEEYLRFFDRDEDTNYSRLRDFLNDLTDDYEPEIVEGKVKQIAPIGYNPNAASASGPIRHQPPINHLGPIAAPQSLIPPLCSNFSLGPVGPIGPISQLGVPLIGPPQSSNLQMDSLYSSPEYQFKVDFNVPPPNIGTKAADMEKYGKGYYWTYQDTEQEIRGPFLSVIMNLLFKAKFIDMFTLVRKGNAQHYIVLGRLFEMCNGNNPFIISEDTSSRIFTRGNLVQSPPGSHYVCQDSRNPALVSGLNPNDTIQELNRLMISGNNASSASFNPVTGSATSPPMSQDYMPLMMNMESEHHLSQPPPIIINNMATKLFQLPPRMENHPYSQMLNQEFTHPPPPLHLDIKRMDQVHYNYPYVHNQDGSNIQNNQNQQLDPNMNINVNINPHNNWERISPTDYWGEPLGPPKITPYVPIPMPTSHNASVSNAESSTARLNLSGMNLLQNPMMSGNLATNQFMNSPVIPPNLNTPPPQWIEPTKNPMESMDPLHIQQMTLLNYQHNIQKQLRHIQELKNIQQMQLQTKMQQPPPPYEPILSMPLINYQADPNQMMEMKNEQMVGGFKDLIKQTEELKVTENKPMVGRGAIPKPPKPQVEVPEKKQAAPPAAPRGWNIKEQDLSVNNYALNFTPGFFKPPEENQHENLAPKKYNKYQAPGAVARPIKNKEKFTWGNVGIAPAEVIPFAEIQAQEQKQVAKNMEKTYDPIPRIGSTKYKSKHIWVKSKTSKDGKPLTEGFWDTQTGKGKNGSEPSTSNAAAAAAAAAAQPVQAPQAAAQASSSKVVSPPVKSGKGTRPKSFAPKKDTADKSQEEAEIYEQFLAWAKIELLPVSSELDGTSFVNDFVSFLWSIKDPFELEDYIKLYLNDTKFSNDFVKNFLQQRSRMYSKNKPIPCDDLCSPAPAFNPSVDRRDDNKGRNKKKKNKMHKVDALNLGFNATASENRFNVGNIDVP